MQNVNENEVLASEHEYEQGTDAEESTAEAEEQDSSDASADGDDGNAGNDEPGDAGETDESRRERAQAQIDRLKTEKAQLQEKLQGYEKSSQASEQVNTADNLDVVRLEARGVLDAEDQATVLKYAKAEGVSPVDALNDPFVKARLDHNKKQREQKAATPANTGRAGKTTKDLSYYVARYQKDGSLPSDAKLVNQILEELKKGS